MAQIEIDGVGKVYQEDAPDPIVAIDRIDLEIDRNQFITIVLAGLVVIPFYESMKRELR